jgi:acyl carrier protein
MNIASVQEWIMERIALMLEVDVASVDAHSPLESFGLGSRDATELVAGLQSWLKVELPPTLLYDHEDIDSLSAYVAAQAAARAS